MELSDWIGGEVASLRQRAEGGFIDVVPVERWREHVDGGGIAPVYVLWHTARHHDLAINAVLRRRPAVLDDWMDRVGIAADTWRGLAEGQDHELVDQLDPHEVGRYFLAVLDESLAWLAGHPPIDPQAVPDAQGALTEIQAPVDRFSWLYDMWAGKPVQFFVGWEAVGHGFNHLGELTSIRNRMGLSPF